MPLYKVEAINLRSTKFGEADKLVTIFTRTKGKLKAVARSACKSGSTFGGRLEPLAYNSLLLAKGRSLDILSQAQTIESFHSIREKEKSLKAGLYMSKLIDCYLDEGMIEPELFSLLLESLRSLKSGAMPQLVTRVFDIRFADIEGFLPCDKFLGEARAFVVGAITGKLSGARVSKGSIREVDRVLMPCLCDHLGKDIRIWKNQ